MKKSDYQPAGWNTKPYTEEELSIVSDELKKALIAEARYRYPRAAKIAANAMLGVAAMFLKSKESKDG